ncbi:HET-domain-containing protein [Plenodomus tracheiphilus IPT5]|uniref:HET-domain-containing protein n=1 Tax=Plenodomus tracheiphilus IPT5 TaxID=1408161 RepID=A0A6A7BGE2_9PLEO|nr:HET-domain-containing protein [Plenodomus tracheiphilus IPT5]
MAIGNRDLPQVYPAAKLDLVDRTIRLVHLLPGRYADAIACELVTANLNDQPEYYALSYAWGDRTNPQQILLNGASHNITRNLEAALRRLRHTSDVLVFWIDMICIDQTCVEERTHQVNLMQYIYSGAREGILWLGDCFESTLQGSEIPSKPAQDAEALEGFTNCSWWHRIWTVQEAVLPPTVTIQLGWLLMSWDSLVAAAQNLNNHWALGCCSVPEAYKAPLAAFSLGVMEIKIVRTLYHSGKNAHFLSSLHRFRGRLSTDPRDKLFALLGLCNRPTCFRVPEVDYTLSAEAIYKRYFISLLQDDGDLDLLARQPEIGRQLDLPTWMPDWSAKVDESRAGIHRYLMRNLHIYQASGTTLLGQQFSITETTLHVRGAVFDEVTMLDDLAFGALQFIQDISRYLKTRFNVTGREAYVGGGDWEHAIWLTYIMDQILVHSHGETNSRRATPEDYTLWQNGTLKDPIPDYRNSFRFFMSKKGYVGFGPRNTQIGDTVSILLGGSVPFVLRRRNIQAALPEQRPEYGYIGHCYVHGIMDGEALEGMDVSKLAWINLI